MPVHAQTIDFEALPGGAATTDLQPITTEYAAVYGVTFSLLSRDKGLPIGSPLIAKAGPCSAVESSRAAAPAGYDMHLLSRTRVTQHGDFVVLGNTMGWDCASSGANPVVGHVGYCGGYVADTAPDILWRSDDAGGTAMASTAITPDLARTTAVLNLPAGADVTHAVIYWAAPPNTITADQEILLERADGSGGTLFSEPVIADDSWEQDSDWYRVVQCMADVTALVHQHGSGAYRVGDLEFESPVDLDSERFFAAWSMVVFYELEGAPLRYLELCDGFDVPESGSPSTVSVSGFLVPVAGYDAKLGILAYEGDRYFFDDGLRFGTAPLDATDDVFDALNPAVNIFNGSRTYLGAPVSVSGDLPQLAGTMETMGGMDLDVFDVTSRVFPGQTTAAIEAFTNGDSYYVGAVVFSTSTHAPCLNDATKLFEDLNGGLVNPGDTLRYTIEVSNSGSDAGIDIELIDLLDANVDLVPGSLAVVGGANVGPKTDVVGDDQAEYDPNTHTVGIRLGSGADFVSGGTLSVLESTAVSFNVVVQDGFLGWISNQADILFTGADSSPRAAAITDGDDATPGDQPTAFQVVEASGVPRAGASRLVLHACRPNPFNPQTTISFEILDRQMVTLRVFDVSGRLVKSLITHEERHPGFHESVWNGRNESGRQVASGTYFYRLEAGAFSEAKRMTLVK
ncbi:MAG: DUF11 domain-containing protein [bacterium]|nr:DUF11 domain-containing protein [bacterium]